MRRISQILQILLQHLRKLLLDKKIVRRCLHGLLKLFVWAQRNYRLRHGSQTKATGDASRAGSSVDTQSSVIRLSFGPTRNQEDDIVVACSRDVSPLNDPSTPVTIARPLEVPGYTVHSTSQLSLRTSVPTFVETQARPEDDQTDLHDMVMSPDCENPLGEDIAFSHPTIRPFAPELLPRYDRNIAVPREWYEYKITPFTTSFRKEKTIPGWLPICHPEGAIYFFNESRRVFTDANLYENENLIQVNSDIDSIDDFFRSRNMMRTSNIDLVLELVKGDDNSCTTLYYLADHAKRSIFYVDEFDAGDFPCFYDVQGAESSSHLEHEIQAQYWYHCLMFPRGLELTSNHVNELRDILVHSMGDAMTSVTSTAPYSVDDLQKMLKLVNHLKENVNKDHQGSTCVLSRFMHVFARQRFYDFHGQQSARMGRDQSVHGKIERNRSWLITCASPFLFYAPEVHMRALEGLWVDNKLSNVVWSNVMNKLYSEWQSFTLYGTVILNANVAFLAIQSVDASGADGHGRSPPQIASYASIISSIGCIILGLLLDRQNRTKGRETAKEAATYMLRKSSRALGMETLAIMYSLPYAFLMWGMLAFLAAFLSMCFDHSTAWTWVLVGIVSVAIAAAIVWCIWMAWESYDHRETAEAQPEPEPEISEKQQQLEEDDDRNGKPTRTWSWAASLSNFRRRTCDSDTTVV